MSDVDLSGLYLEPHPINGIIYRIKIPAAVRLNLDKLRQNLNNQVSVETIEPKVDVENIPEVFLRNGKIQKRTQIDDLIIVDNTLFGFVSVDRPEQVEYRGRQFLIMRTIGVPFFIAEYEHIGRYFLILVCKRATSRELSPSLNGFMNEQGLSIDTCQIEQDKIVAVRKQLSGELLDTTLSGFQNSKIHAKRIWGEGFQEEPEYTQDADRSTIRQHKFQFKWPSDTKRESLVTVSEDALIRFWTNLTFQEYLGFLRTFIMPRLTQPLKYMEPALRAFDQSDIFERKIG